MGRSDRGYPPNDMRAIPTNVAKQQLMFLYDLRKVRAVTTKDEIVPGMGEAVEARMDELGISPTELAAATGVSLQGIAPIRKGYRRAYQKRLTRPLCAALYWTPDSIARLLDGQPPVELELPPELTPPTVADVPDVVKLVTAVSARLAKLERSVAGLARRVDHVENPQAPRSDQSPPAPRPAPPPQSQARS